MKKRLLVLAGIILIWSFPAFSEVLKIGVLNFPPYYFVSDENHVSGDFIKIIKKVFNETDLSYEFKTYPPKRLYHSLNQGKVDIWLGPDGDTVYRDHTIKVDAPVSKVTLRCFSMRKGMHDDAPDDLTNKKVIVVLGYNYGGFLKTLRKPENKVLLDESATRIMAFKKLKAGRADYLIDYDLPSKITLKDIEIKELKWTDIRDIGIYFHISMKTENLDEVSKKLKKSINYLKAQGLINAD